MCPAQRGNFNFSHLGKCANNAQLFAMGRLLEGLDPLHEVAEFRGFEAGAALGDRHDLGDLVFDRTGTIAGVACNHVLKFMAFFMGIGVEKLPLEVDGHGFAGRDLW